mgnify:CR=1
MLDENDLAEQSCAVVDLAQELSSADHSLSSVAEASNYRRIPTSSKESLR